jgi:hypothetical protein
MEKVPIKLICVFYAICPKCGEEIVIDSRPEEAEKQSYIRKCWILACQEEFEVISEKNGDNSTKKSI